MKNEVLISCIVPLYNDELYIKRCLESLINQTYQNIEIIIINDGSTDNSEIICNSIIKQDSRIKIISKENSGVCDSRNIGVQEFNGDYAIFVDSDDYVDIDMISDLVDIIKKYNSPDLVTFDYERIYNNSKFDEFKNDGKITIYSSKEAAKKYLQKDKNFSMVLWRRCYKRELLKQIKFNENKLPEDLATAFWFYSNAKTIIHISKSYYKYFIKDNGLSHQNKEKDYINLYDIVTNLKAEEEAFFRTDEDMKVIVNSIYTNYLLTIYSKFFYSKETDIRKRYLDIIDKELSQMRVKKLQLKTAFALAMYRFNKRLLSFILKKKSERDLNNR